MFGRKKPVLVLAAAACAVALVSTPAAADSKKAAPAPIGVVTTKLNGPRQISASHGKLYVTESDAGQVTQVDPRTGRKRVVVSGLSTPQGAVRVGDKIYAVTGEANPDSGPSASPGSAVMVARPGRPAKKFADLLAYELKRNPDRQTQFGPDGAPLDALSNPFFIIRDRSKHGFLLVADAGANAVLKVSRSGKVSTFFVPPTKTTGDCATVPNQNASGFGCDSVPTGLAYGPNGLLYVSALTSEVAGQGRIYVVNPHTGKIVHTISGFSGPTGVAVDSRSRVYVSELLENAPEGDGPPPPDFDPTTVGRIVRWNPKTHQRTYAQVTMPSGLLSTSKALYASAWSIGSFLGIPDAGQVVTVRPSAFTTLS